MKRFLSIIILLIVFFVACSKEEETTIPTLGYSYSGLNLGSSIVYDVDSHHYNLPFLIDTIIQFQRKEVVSEKYIDLEGDEAYKIIRYKRSTPTDPWVLLDVWNAKITTTNYQKTEDNIRFLKLVFPVRINKKWNGNIQNAIGEQEFQYTAVHQMLNVGGISFDSVATVLQMEDINLVQERFFEEKFAAGIGLIYKKSRNVDNKFNSSTGLWQPDTGDDVVMTVNSFVR